MLSNSDKTRFASFIRCLAVVKCCHASMPHFPRRHTKNSVSVKRRSSIRGSTLHRSFLPLKTRNVCHTFSDTVFSESTPGCTSPILSSKPLSADDGPSLPVPDGLLFPFFVFTHISLYYATFKILSTAFFF